MNIIVAVDENWSIGYLGKIQWHVKEDLAYFKAKTLNKTIVMGRKTLESLKDAKPLKNRNNIILTKNAEYKVDDALVLNTLEEVLEAIKDEDPSQIFIIGGESIYKAFLPYCKKAFITKVYGSFQADKYFPNLDQSDQWELTHKSDRMVTENGTHISFHEYERK